MADDWTPDAPLVVGDLSLEILCTCVRDATTVLAYRPWMVFSRVAGKAVACSPIIVDSAPGPEDAASARLACLRAAEGVLRQRAEEAERGLAEVRRRMRAEGWTDPVPDRVGWSYSRLVDEVATLSDQVVALLTERAVLRAALLELLDAYDGMGDGGPAAFDRVDRALAVGRRVLGGEGGAQP